MLLGMLWLLVGRADSDVLMCGMWGPLGIVRSGPGVGAGAGAGWGSSGARGCRGCRGCRGWRTSHHTLSIDACCLLPAARG
jgi:hypothetical protein